MPRHAEQPTVSLVMRGTRYYLQWWEGGRSERLSCRTEDRETAERFRASFLAGRGSPEPPQEPTIGQILDGYLADRQGHVAAYATLRYATDRLRAHLGALIPSHLTRERVRFYHAARRKEGVTVGPSTARRRKPISDGTIIRELVTLRAALRWAERDQWIVRVPHVEVPKAPPARDRWLSRDEADRLIAACQAAHVRLFVVMALHTAARAAALLELRWDQIDLSRRLAHLGNGSGNKRRAIAVPINDTLAAALQVAGEARTTDWVIEFAGRQVRSVKSGFRGAADRAGLPGITPHTLRHTAATWMIQAGIPFEQVARFLGNSVAMIERVYGHHSPEFLLRAARALG